MRIAIPTYKRAILINNLTLGYLKRCGISELDIDLFVSNEREAEQYRSIGGDSRIIIANVNSVRDKFNKIHSFYDPGTEVVVMEDDLKSIKYLAGYNKLEERLNISDDFRLGFDMCATEGTKLWGINSNSNPFFMKADPSVGYKFVVANCYGFIAEDPAYQGVCESKTDYERTIVYYKRFGKVVRLDYLCPVTTNYSTPGGMQDIVRERAAMEEASVEYLTKTYLDLCSRNTKKKSLYPEMTLKARKGVTPEPPSNDAMAFL